MTQEKAPAKLLIVKNITREGPGILGELLGERGIGYDLIDLYAGEQIPETGNYAGMVVLGGPQSANDTTPTMLHELQRVREWLATGRPYIGVCLGLQVMVKAAGGHVEPCAVTELGFHEPDGEPFTVSLTPEGRMDPIFNGLADRLRVFQLHGETVVPTPDMTLLGYGKGCRMQVVRYGDNAWGLQCHFELTPAMLATWTLEDADLVTMDRERLLAEFSAIEPEYTAIGRTILANFIKRCGFNAD